MNCIESSYQLKLDRKSPPSQTHDVSPQPLPGKHRVELVHEDLDNKSEMMLRHNPVHKTVPVVLHGARTIYESLLVVEYPSDCQRPTPDDCSAAQFWAHFNNNKLSRLFWLSLVLDGGRGA
jgi:glutathione S-transferase